jgi:YD repeat-containing protein
MWQTSDREQPLDPDLTRNVPVTPGSGRSAAWTRVERFVWRHLFFFAVAVGISFAVIYFETSTRLFFSFNPPRQVGDPCLSLIRPTDASETTAVWSNFGDCAGPPRDPDRETVVVDLRSGLLVHYKTEPLLMGTLPVPFTRVLRNQDHVSRAFGTGGTHTYDMALVGDAPRLSWVDLVLAGGRRIHYLPTDKPGSFDSDVAGYFGETTLQWTGRGWRIQRDDGSELLFPESENATRLEQAALIGMQTADGGSELVIERDPAGNILSIGAGDRRLDFAHDTENRVTAISAAGTGQPLRFDYDSAGCLVRQTGPGGEFLYEYDRRDRGCRLRRTIQDGVRYFEADYNDDDRVIRLAHQDGGAYVFAYETDRRGQVVRADVTDPAGTLRRITLDDAGYWIGRWGSYRGR